MQAGCTGAAIGRQWTTEYGCVAWLWLVIWSGWSKKLLACCYEIPIIAFYILL